MLTDTSDNALYNQVHWVIRTPYLSIEASNATGGGVSHTTITLDALDLTLQGPAPPPTHRDPKIQGLPSICTGTLPNIGTPWHTQTCSLWTTYGWQVGGLHPIGILSCYHCNCDWTVPEDTVPTNIYTSSYLSHHLVQYKVHSLAGQQSSQINSRTDVGDK